MAREEFEVLQTKDLSAEDKWNILYNYLDFSARVMSMNAMIHRDDKQVFYENVSSAASLKTIRDIMKDEQLLIRCMAEMQDPKKAFIRSFPMYYDQE